MTAPSLTIYIVLELFVPDPGMQEGAGFNILAVFHYLDEAIRVAEVHERKLLRLKMRGRDEEEKEAVEEKLELELEDYDEPEEDSLDP